MNAEETLQTITDMRSLVTISLLFIYSTVFAQDEKSLKAASAAFHNALVEQDTAAPVSYTHLDVYKRQALHLVSAMCCW